MDVVKPPEDLDETLSSHNESVGEIRCNLRLKLKKLSDENEQLRYEFRMTKEAHEAELYNYNDEIDHWKTKSEISEAKIKQQLKEFEEEKVRLKNENIEDTSNLSEKINELELENQKLKTELKDFKKNTELENSNFEKVQILEDEISNLKNEVSNFSMEIKILEHTCIEWKDKYEALVKENEEYKETLDMKRQEVRESNTIISELNDELTILRQELKDLQCQPRDLNTRGNSLFAEVYDSRNKIKEQYKKLILSFNRVYAEKERLENEIGILRSRNLTMRDIFNNDMKQFKPGNLFEIGGERDSMCAMRSLLESYKDEIDRLKREEPPAERDYRYYEAVIQRQKKDIEKLRGSLSEHTFSHALKAREFTQMSYDKACLKSGLSELQTDKRHLELKIEQLENKILDLEDNNSKSGDNKENKNWEENQTNVKKENKCKVLPENRKKNLQDDSGKTLEETYGATKVRIITQEEIEALKKKELTMLRKPKNINERKLNDKDENKVETNDKEKESDVKKEDNPSNSHTCANKDHESKKEVRFTCDTKKEDGQNRRPRGKNSYYYDPITNSMVKRS